MLWCGAFLDAIRVDYDIKLGIGSQKHGTGRDHQRYNSSEFRYWFIFKRKCAYSPRRSCSADNGKNVWLLRSSDPHRKGDELVCSGVAIVEQFEKIIKWVNAPCKRSAFTPSRDEFMAHSEVTTNQNGKNNSIEAFIPLVKKHPFIYHWEYSAHYFCRSCLLFLQIQWFL